MSISLHMLKGFINKLYSIADEGIHHELDDVLHLKVNTTNQLLIIGSFVLSLFIIFNIIMGYYLAIPVDLLILANFYFAFKLNKKGKHNIGIPLFTFSTIILTFLPALFLPYLPGYEVLFLVFMGSPIVLFPSDQVKLKNLAIFLCIFLFYYTRFELSRSLVQQNEFDQIATTLFLYTTSIIILIMEFRFWENLTLKMRNELIESQTTMIHNNQLSNLGIMSGGIAHEINNPLTIIKTSNFILQKKVNEIENNDLKEIFNTELKNQDSAIVRIVKIIHGIRSLSRNTKDDQLRAENLNEIIDETQILCVNKAINLNIKFEFHPSHEYVEIPCNRTQISQVLLNLIDNAFDAVMNQANGWVKVNIKTTDKNAIIEVIDSGNGIPKDVAKKIMTPFYTTKPTGKGTGLGLSLSKKIIKRHNGELFYDFKKENTTFIIKLPRISSLVD